MRISEVTRIPPQSVDPTVKNYHWLDLDLALLDAYDHDADLVVLRDLSGAITEGPGYNVFAHLDGRWLTPGRGTLAGITRRSVIELACEAGHRVDEGLLTAADLLRSDEVLVTSTAGGVMAVTVIDGKPVGPGIPGRSRPGCGTGTGPATRTRATPPRSATSGRPGGARTSRAPGRSRPPSPPCKRRSDRLA